MKQAILPISAMALLLASCDSSTKDSYQTIPFREYNLIVDTQDASADALASLSDYEVKYNITQNCVDVKTTDIIVNNQKYSFETDTMAIRPKYFTYDGTSTYYLSFSKAGNAGIGGVGSAVSDIAGSFVSCYMPTTNDLLNPSFDIAVSSRLDMSYLLTGRYKVQTFWASALYLGQTTAVDGSDTYTTKGSNYIAQFNFDKKQGTVYIYNAEFSADKEKALPKIISLEEVPIKFTHDGFYLESESPKTKVLGVKDNKSALVDSVGFAASDFSLRLTSSDLADALITYKLDGKNVSFRGTSMMKGNQ